MNEKELNPYDLTNYDMVYIILRSVRENYPVKKDLKKNKLFLKGILISFSSYPRSGCLAFVNEKNIQDYKNAKTGKEKVNFIINVFYGDIESITVQFDDFDWK